MNPTTKMTKTSNTRAALGVGLLLVCGSVGLSTAVAQPAVDTPAPSALRQDAAAEPVRNTDEWNLPKSQLAIKGYDPVAYFPEGGGKAKKGNSKITTVYKGVTYRFVDAANRDRFVANPSRYEPAHGGWCSFAMIEGGKTKPSPKNFIVKDNRLFLFYKGLGGDTKKAWQKANHERQADGADGQWESVSGERPREIPAV